MDELSNEIHAEMVEQERDELIELLKKPTIMLSVSRVAFWQGDKWVTYDGNIRIYRGDSLLEALKILTKKD